MKKDLRKNIAIRLKIKEFENKNAEFHASHELQISD
jgi:hypothetical protein